MSEEDAHIYKLSQPTCLTKLMVNCPCCVLVVALVTMVLIGVFVFQQGWLLPNN